MHFEFERIAELPRLAWVACVLRNRNAIRVLHGPWVETREQAFVEGAWDGAFQDFQFPESTMLVGSGACITEEGLLFAGHSDLHERLYSIRQDDALWVSPSLALLLATSGEALDPRYPHYYLNFVDAYRAGIRYPDKHLRIRNGRMVQMHDVCNLRITPHLEITRVEKSWASPPANYREYETMMQQTLDRVIRNAGDPARRHPFRPVCMISQGYDSVAVAALASRSGCQEAVTYRLSGSAAGVLNDDGSEIGAVLGYTTTPYDRPQPQFTPRPREEEFYLEPWGVDREILPMEGQLVGSLLLSGRSTSGWQVGEGPRWGLPGNSGLPDLQRPIDYTPGCALTDFRMRVGFLHFAVPAVGAIYAPLLHRWTESAEMRPWRVGGSYDKPIPRRIAEQAGVPRHMFGQSKMGGPLRTPARSPMAKLLRFYRDAIYWAPLRVLIRRTLGNRLHPYWRLKSFEIQNSAEIVIARYRQALSTSSASPMRD